MESKDEVSDTDSGIILQSGEGFGRPRPHQLLESQAPGPARLRGPRRGRRGGHCAGKGVQTLEGLRVFLPGWGGGAGSGLECQSYLNSYLPCSAPAP